MEASPNEPPLPRSPRTLEGKTALITGGGSGIGRATAIRLAEEGAEIWVAGLQENDLAETQDLVGKTRCHYVTCDITRENDLKNLLPQIPKLDHLICCAGVSFPSVPSMAHFDTWEKMIAVNQSGTLRTCLMAGDKMRRENAQGRIVIVSSILDRLAEKNSGAYGMAKAAISQLTRQLAAEWGPQGLLVNAVAPGMIETPMSSVLGENECESAWFKQYFIHPDRPRIPLQRQGYPEEVAEAILFLVNPRNTYCTGQVLTIDGGLTSTF